MIHTNTTSLQGYSIIAAVLMIGFLLVLTTSTLNLVLQEMQDWRGRQDYMKAFAWAEGAMELWLLDIKTKWYGYDDDTYIDIDTFTGSIKSPLLSYEFDSNRNAYTGSIDAYGLDIIPLFSIDSSGAINSIQDIQVNITSTQLPVWNIITETAWFSWKWWLSYNDIVWEKRYDETSWDLVYDTSSSISSLLSGEDYLILQNLSWDTITYEILGSGWGFTLPRASISSSATIWKYTQNLQTQVDNTEFLWILKYSIFWWN